MNLSTLLFILVLTAACSKSVAPPTKPAGESNQEPAAQIYNLKIIANDETEAQVVDFGEFSKDTNTSRTVTIQNSSTSSIQLNDLKSLTEAWDDDTSDPNSITFSDHASPIYRCNNKLLASGKICIFYIRAIYNPQLDNSIYVIPLTGADPLTSPTLQLVLDVSESWLTSEAILKSGTALVKSSEVLNFGILTPGTNVTRRLYISNLVLVPVASPTLPSLPTGLVVSRNTCTGSINKEASCFIDFSYSHQPQNLNETILFNAPSLTENFKSLQLNAINIQDTVIDSAPKLSFVYQDFPISTSNLSTYVRRLVVTNNSNVTPYGFGSSETAALFTDPTLTILRNTCDGRSIRPGKDCYVDVQHRPVSNNQYVEVALELPNANVSQVMSVGEPPVPCTVENSGINNSLALSGNLPACVVTQCEPNYLIDNNSCVAEACVLADFPNSLTLLGDKAQGCLVETCESNYEIVGNSCSPISCTPASIANSQTVSGTLVSGCVVETCQLNYTKDNNLCTPTACNPANFPNAASILGDMVQGCSIQTCATNYELNNGACSEIACTTSAIANSQAVSGTLVSGCVVDSCVENYTKENNACNPSICELEDFPNAQAVSGSKVVGCIVDSCNENYTQSGNSCTPSVCSLTDFPNALLLLGDKVAGCTVSSCEENYSNINNACVPAQCLPQDYPNSLAISGDKVIGCTVDSCQTNYSLSSNVCSPSVCNLADYPFSAIISGDKVAGCVIEECATYYKKSLDNQLCLAKSCNELTALEQTTLGYNLTSATLSGTYPACALSCSSARQQLAVDGFSCVDKVPSGSISFAQAYTNLESNNILNIVNNNNLAQQIQFYSDAACNTTAGSVQSIAPYILINLSNGDGIKRAYAKLINGVAQSECLTASIVLDKTVPSIAISNPTESQQINSTTVSISGTCSDLGTGINGNLSLIVNGVTSSAACSSGSFTASADISGLPLGIILLTVSATDLAGNINTITRNIEKISALAVLPAENTLASGASYTCVVGAGNVLSCLGENVYGQFGTGYSAPATEVGQSMPAESPITTLIEAYQGQPIKYFSGGGISSCAIMNDNTVKCAGAQIPATNTAASKVPVVSFGGVAVKKVLVRRSACAILNNNTVMCSGSDYYGNFGRSIGFASMNILPPTLSFGGVQVKDMGSNGNTLCVILMDDTVSCAGQNTHGVLGRGASTPTSSSTPAPAFNSEKVKKVVVAENATCVILLNDTVKCVGNNSSGMFGNGTTDSSVTPVVAFGGVTVKNIEAYQTHMCSILMDDTVRCSGTNGYGQIGNGLSAPTSNAVLSPFATFGTSPVKHVTVGVSHTCALLADDTLKCVGRNNYGQLGTGDTGEAVATPIVSFLKDSAVGVESGFNTVCVLLTGNKVRCWGRNNKGQLANGFWTETTSGFTTARNSFEGNLVKKIFGGSEGYTCAILTNDTMKCSGENYYATFGGVGGSVQIAPLAPFGANAILQASRASNLLCAVYKSDNKIRCMGRGSNGTGPSQPATGLGSTPVLSFGGIAVKKVSLSQGLNCVLKVDNTVMCSGTEFSNMYGQLGNGNTTAVTAAQVNTLLPAWGSVTVKDVEAAGSYSCIVNNSDAVQCAGYNNSGQIGNGTTSTVTTPFTLFNGSPVKKMYVTSNAVCALMFDNSVKCSGHNGGAFGTGDSLAVSTPIDAYGGELFKSFSLSIGGSCGMTTADEVLCSGSYVGNGSSVRSPSPMPVIW